MGGRIQRRRFHRRTPRPSASSCKRLRTKLTSSSRRLRHTTLDSSRRTRRSCSLLRGPLEPSSLLERRLLCVTSPKPANHPLKRRKTASTILTTNFQQCLNYALHTMLPFRCRGAL